MRVRAWVYSIDLCLYTSHITFRSVISIVSAYRYLLEWKQCIQAKWMSYVAIINPDYIYMKSCVHMSYTRDKRSREQKKWKMASRWWCYFISGAGISSSSSPLIGPILNNKYKKKFGSFSDLTIFYASKSPLMGERKFILCNPECSAHLLLSSQRIRRQQLRT